MHAIGAIRSSEDCAHYGCARVLSASALLCVDIDTEHRNTRSELLTDTVGLFLSRSLYRSYLLLECILSDRRYRELLP